MVRGEDTSAAKAADKGLKKVSWDVKGRVGREEGSKKGKGSGGGGAFLWVGAVTAVAVAASVAFLFQDPSFSFSDLTHKSLHLCSRLP